MVFRRPGDMRLQTGNKRKIFGLSGYTIFFTFWLLLPLLVYPLIFVGGKTELWPLIFVEIPWLTFFFLVGARNFYGVISFFDQTLKVSTNKPYAFDGEAFSFKVAYDDICGISFMEKDGSKNGDINYKLRVYSAPLIELTTNDDSKYYILLYPFTRRQWVSLQKELVKRNPEIIVLDSAQDLIRRRGHAK